MAVQTISTKELRENFLQVKASLEAGQSIMLLYRSKPLAELKPVSPPIWKRRIFSRKQLEGFISDDQLSEKDQNQINETIKNLP